LKHTLRAMKKIDKNLNKINRVINYYLSPIFIEKHSILQSIKFLLDKYNKELQNKKLLDIGCGSKPYESFFKKLDIIYKGIDLKEFSKNLSFELNKPDFYFHKNYKKDFKMPQFKNDSYDIITAFQILEHHEKPELFFSEAGRILKKGGYLIISSPFIWELHEEPNDFQRLTHYKIQKLCGENSMVILETIRRGGILSTLSQLANLSLLDSILPKMIRKGLYRIFLLPCQYLAYFYETFLPYSKRKIFLGYTFLIIKR